jgi:hypothetical protein
MRIEQLFVLTNFFPSGLASDPTVLSKQEKGSCQPRGSFSIFFSPPGEFREFELTEARGP